MAYAVYKGERNLTELARRLYGIAGRGAQERAREAAEAILGSNPHLADLSKLREGVLINVPKLEGLEPTVEASAGGEMRTALAAQLTRGIDAALARLGDSAKREDASLKDAIKAVTNETAKAALTERRKEVQAFRKAQQSVLEELSADLKKLIERVL